MSGRRFVLESLALLVAAAAVMAATYLYLVDRLESIDRTLEVCSAELETDPAACIPVQKETSP